MEKLEASQPRDEKIVEKEAVAWFTRMNGKPSRSEKRSFAEWLQASPEHGQAYEEVRHLWSDLRPIAESAEAGTDDLTEALERIGQYRRQGRVSKIGSVTAGCLVIMLASSWLWLERPNFIQDLSADYVTAKAERRTISLSDGSTILLDADTAIADKTSADERRVHLLRGTVSFTVQPSAIPFVVEAQDGEARVLGTRFDMVMTDSGNVTVTLASGSVEVGLTDRQDEVRLQPGESVQYDATGLGNVTSVDLQESLAWHEGRLIFTNSRLADVLGRIERYRHGRIVLVGSTLGERRISGNISLQNTDAALAAVQASVGFRITTIGGRLTIVSQ